MSLSQEEVDKIERIHGSASSVSGNAKDIASPTPQSRDEQLRADYASILAGATTPEERSSGYAYLASKYLTTATSTVSPSATNPSRPQISGSASGAPAPTQTPYRTPPPKEDLDTLTNKTSNDAMDLTGSGSSAGFGSKQVTAIFLCVFVAICAFAWIGWCFKKRKGGATITTAAASGEAQSHWNQHRDLESGRTVSAEIRRREEVVRRGIERRRIEAIYLEQLNSELAREGQMSRDKPPNYSPRPDDAPRAFGDGQRDAEIEMADRRASTNSPTVLEAAHTRVNAELPEYVDASARSDDRGADGTTNVRRERQAVDDALAANIPEEAPPAYRPPSPGAPVAAARRTTLVLPRIDNSRMSGGMAM